MRWPARVPVWVELRGDLAAEEAGAAEDGDLHGRLLREADFTTPPLRPGATRFTVMRMLGSHPFTVFANPRAGTPGLTVLPEAGFRRARAEITAWPGYAPTPLRDLPAIAAAAGLGALRLKDEAGRFGLGSFKALGGAYAVAELLADELARRGVAPAATSAELLAGRWAG